MEEVLHLLDARLDLGEVCAGERRAHGARRVHALPSVRDALGALRVLFGALEFSFSARVARLLDTGLAF